MRSEFRDESRVCPLLQKSVSDWAEDIPDGSGLVQPGIFRQ